MSEVVQSDLQRPQAVLDWFLEQKEKNAHYFIAFIIVIASISLSFYHMFIAFSGSVEAHTFRSTHLSLILILAFLLRPMGRKSWKSPLNAWFTIDVIIILIVIFIQIYTLYDIEEYIFRRGDLTDWDLRLGTIFVFIVLEATRRMVGWAMVVIAGFFLVHTAFSDYFFGIFFGPPSSWFTIIDYIFMRENGIFGIPLMVMATYIFLFILFGSFLIESGAGRFFINVALALTGYRVGGPAKAAVVSSALMASVSGSAVANVVTTGSFTIPLMKKVGYPAKKAAAVEVAASTDGQLAPPIMGAAAFIIAEYVNVPYLAVIKAAAIPAFASYAALFFITHIEASKLGLRGLARKELPPFFRTLLSGVHFLVPLTMLLYELIIARHSPELAAFNAIWVMAIIMLFQNPVKAYLNKEPIGEAFKLSIVQIFSALANGARNMCSVALATAAAGIIVGVVAMGLGGLITGVIEVLSGGNIFLLLVITAVASLIIGMGLPTTATYIVMASLTAPVIVEVGGYMDFIVPLMAAHLFCFYFGILADDTPPVGLAAYAAAAIAKSPPIATGLQGFMYDIRTAILPFMFIFNSDLILHNINSWPQGILIFIMACLGNFAFASATQGWYFTRVKIWEVPIFLMATLVLMRPDLIASWVGLPHDQRYWTYLIGLAIMGLLYLMQRPRIQKAEPVPVT